jgi:hypothetical protein
MIWDGWCSGVSSYETFPPRAFYSEPSEPLFIAIQILGAKLLIPTSPAPTATATSTEAAAPALTARSSTFSMVGPRARLIHIHLLPLEVLPVEILDGGLGFGLLGHLNEPEPS